MIILSLIIMLVAVAVTTAGCISDFRYMRIPNRYSLAIAVGFFLSWVITPSVFFALWEHVMAAVLMLGITYILFVRGMIGGGDCKLGAALALWTGLPGLMAYLLYTAMMGGVLGCMGLYMVRKKPFKNPPADSWIGRAQNGEQQIPYGIAISIGAWASFFHIGILSNYLNEVSKIIH